MLSKESIETLYLLFPFLVVVFATSIAWYKDLFQKRFILQPIHISLSETITPFILYLSLGTLVTTSFFLFDNHFKFTHFFSSKESSQVDLKPWINFFSFIIVALLLLLYCHFQNRRILQAFFGTRIRIKKNRHFFQKISYGIYYCLITLPFILLIGNCVNFCLLFLFNPIDNSEQIAVQHLKSTLSHYPLFICTCLLLTIFVPFIEEILFRGYLQHYLSQYFHTKYTIFLSSMTFTLFHFSPSQGLTNVPLLSSLFCLSCFLSLVYKRSGSLWSPIALHSFFNLFSIINIFINHYISIH